MNMPCFTFTNLGLLIFNNNMKTIVTKCKYLINLISDVIHKGIILGYNPTILQILFPILFMHESLNISTLLIP